MEPVWFSVEISQLILQFVFLGIGGTLTKAKKWHAFSVKFIIEIKYYHNKVVRRGILYCGKKCYSVSTFFRYVNLDQSSEIKASS